MMVRVEKKMAEGHSEVVVCGLGVAINRAINLALQLQRRSTGFLQVATTTSTVEVSDELIPMLDECDFGTRLRNVSAVSIRLFK